MRLSPSALILVGVVGRPGIGKSRLVREIAAMAGRRGVEVFSAFCESHTSQVPFHAVARLLRAATGVEGLDGQEARDRVRDRVPDADPEDVLLFDDLLGIGDPNAPLPPIDPDARRRRLTTLVNAASLTRETPAVYVVEDAHWIDEVSELMIADFLTVIPQTPSLVLVTYRPEYEGALARVHGAQTIALAPLSIPEIASLIGELLGPDPSVTELGDTIAQLRHRTAHTLLLVRRASPQIMQRRPRLVIRLHLTVSGGVCGVLGEPGKHMPLDDPVPPAHTYLPA